MMLRVFVVDDHPVVRDGLKHLIDAQPQMCVVGEAADGLAAVDGVAEALPDVVVMDVSMPRLSGAEATQRIKTARPAVKVLALTAHEDGGYVRLLLDVGASGYVLKRAAADDLVRAILAIAAGETYVDPDVATAAAAPAERASPREPARAELSEREAEVLRYIARGHAMKETAAALSLSARTVETYKARAMEKLGLGNRAGIVRYALERGWLKSD